MDAFSRGVQAIYRVFLCKYLQRWSIYYVQNPPNSGCDLFLKLPLGSQVFREERSSGPSGCSGSKACPHAPAPGVSINKRSPLPMKIVAFPPMLILRGSGSPCTPSG